MRISLTLILLLLHHKLYKYPELAFEEFGTTIKILENIQNLEGAHRLKIHTPMDTGLLVEYKTNDRKLLLFRADINAFPPKEENDMGFKSKNYCMTVGD